MKKEEENTPSGLIYKKQLTF